MAEGNVKVEKIEENLTCSVCFNIYREPHELTCRHTLCLECIIQLQKGAEGRVECPECRKVSKRTEVKKDFKLQRIIDVLNVVEPESEKKQEMKPDFPDKCEVCEESGQPITSICTICNQYMCRACEKAHRGSKATKNHPITSVQQLTDQIQTNLKKTLTQTAQEVNNIGSKFRIFDEKIVEVNSDKDQQLRLLHQYEEEWIQDIRKHCLEMSKRIIEANDSVVLQCTVIKDICKNSEKELNSHRETLNDLINTTDATTLLKSAEMVDSNIQENLREIQKKVSEMNMPNQSPLRVERGMKWESNTGPQVTVNNDEHDRTGAGVNTVTPTHWAGIPLMLQNTYRQDKIIKLDRNPNRMCIINDNIWIIDEGNNMKTYDYNLELIHSAKVEDCAMSMTYDDRCNQQIITAHSSDMGLHQYDLQGHHVQQICTGNYADVVTHNRKLYALSPKPSPTLHVFTNNDNQWLKYFQVKLCCNKSSFSDKICIIGDCLHLSAYNSNCIYKYNLESDQLHQQIGMIENSRHSIDISRPRISGCHSDTGAILVADWGNNRLQVYSSFEDEWSVVRIQGDKLMYPRQALVDKHAENIWVMTVVPCSLIKYIKSQ